MMHKKIQVSTNKKKWIWEKKHFLHSETGFYKENMHSQHSFYKATFFLIFLRTIHGKICGLIMHTC